MPDEKGTEIASPGPETQQPVQPQPLNPTEAPQQNPTVPNLPQSSNPTPTTTPEQTPPTTPVEPKAPESGGNPISKFFNRIFNRG